MEKLDKNIKVPDFEWHCYGCGAVYPTSEEHNCRYAEAMLSIQILIIVVGLSALF